MPDQLSPSPDLNPDNGINAPQESPVSARKILGDNLPQKQQTQTQATKKVLPTIAANDNALPLTLGDTDYVQEAKTIALIDRLFLKALIGGTSFSIQAAVLEKRRQLARKTKSRKTPQEVMLEHARSVIGNPDQNTPPKAKAA